NRGVRWRIYVEQQPGGAQMQRRNFVAGGLALILALGQVSPARPATVDPFQVLGKSLGMTKDQMQGGLGSMLKLAQEKLAKGDFDKVASAIPGAGQLMNKAKGLGAISGPVKDLAGLDKAFTRLGISEKTASKFLSSVPEIVSKAGGEDVGKLL